MDYSEEQGYAKEILNDWVASDGVGARKYDDLTAIGMFLCVYGMEVDLDWIHEYTKERVRRRNLASRPGLLNRIKLAMDASQAWIILTCTGVFL